MADAPTPPLLSSWQVRSLAGEPPATISVRNLQATVEAGLDAWGRAGRTQPVLISAEVVLRRSFEVAASKDAVGADTVHYGMLSKAILAAVERMGRAAAYDEKKKAEPLRGLLERLWATLTGLDLWGRAAGPAGAAEKPFLDISLVRLLSVAVHLPKASLLGEGVGLAASAVFQGTAVEAHGLALRLHRLRVPTLIGVNGNERQAKQVVVADVEIERFDHGEDVYPELEELVVKVRNTCDPGDVTPRRRSRR